MLESIINGAEAHIHYSEDSFPSCDSLSPLGSNEYLVDSKVREHAESGGEDNLNNDNDLETTVLEKEY